ncbi:similar to DnaK suppressor protein (partial length) [Desulfotalea psychrophila LSv54]|uniref:Similar to DnaK suppressor protein (Partial length) n=1 Tax=Desulfotalea psychrophila (strain LSv54 / DSM 12343) TaxID=177439 RepID=Q6APB9_DESPS|nr:similar to DnaK suppressor protein (partial length) [Desulfotalea psychrophila LSv54]
MVDQMNKQQLTVIKTSLLEQMKSPVNDLQVQRLTTALARINAENFGECFICKQEIPFSILKINPERVICDKCLEETNTSIV